MAKGVAEVQVKVPLITLQLKPGTVDPESVVPGGMGNVSVGFAAALGPLFVTTPLIVRVVPAVTGTGVLVRESANSVCVAAATIVVNTAVLFAGILSEMTFVVIVDVLVIVVLAGKAGTVRFSTKFWLYPTGRSAMEQKITPPTGGLQLQPPPGFVRDT
jgi:hypothetical protein